MKELRSHYFDIEKTLIRIKQEHKGYQDYIDSFVVQINSKIVELDNKREELQGKMAKVA